jgi:bacteriorhodopsin
MKAIVESTLNASLWIQWITLFMNLFALSVPIPDIHSILKSVLGLETIVQAIQLSFYTWYAFQVHRIADVTRYRYIDWVVTTPLMLFTTMVYYEYRNNPEKTFTLEEFWNRYWKESLVVGGFNLAMLVFGYLQEIGILGLVASTIFGFAGLIGSFATIYTQFASKTSSNLPLFWFMASVWSLYGVAAWFPTTLKNASYNILDIFAKNFYGVFLSYMIYNLSTV